MKDIMAMTEKEVFELRVRTFLKLARLDSDYRIELRSNKSDGDHLALVALYSDGHTRTVGKGHTGEDIANLLRINNVLPNALEIWRMVQPGQEISDFKTYEDRRKQQEKDIKAKIDAVAPMIEQGVRRTIKDSSIIFQDRSSYINGICLQIGLDKETKKLLLELDEMNHRFVNNMVAKIFNGVVGSDEIRPIIHLAKFDLRKADDGFAERYGRYDEAFIVSTDEKRLCNSMASLIKGIAAGDNAMQKQLMNISVLV